MTKRTGLIKNSQHLYNAQLTPIQQKERGLLTPIQRFTYTYTTNQNQDLMLTLKKKLNFETLALNFTKSK